MGYPINRFMAKPINTLRGVYMARPKGSKSKSKKGYKARTASLKRQYGADIFKKWGKKGGNPILLKRGRKKT